MRCFQEPRTKEYPEYAQESTIMPRANLVAVQEMLLVASALLAVVSAYDSYPTFRNPGKLELTI